MNYLSLFSGIGGLDLGLDRAGMTCVGQVERDPFCRRVLTKHWPEVPRHDDVRTAVEWWQSESRPAVHLVAGGFPCQPVSKRGHRRGQTDERWLWPHVAGIVRHLRPRWVLLENVPGLLRRGMGDVLGELAASGYDAEWDCVPAAAVGAHHERDRIFIVAYPAGVRCRRLGWVGASRCRPLFARPRRTAWRAEPRVGRVAHGLPARVDRVRSLGNAVVPAVGEHIGRLITGAAAGVAS